MLGNFLDTITIPSPVVNPNIIRENVMRMKKKIESFNANFRPHFKTHQCAYVGTIVRECGVNQIAVSSVSMAFYFAKNGWKDITLAIPFNIRELKPLLQLAQKIDVLNIMIDHEQTAQYVAEHVQDAKLGIFFKIDTGYKRCGVQPQEYEAVDKLLSIIGQNNNLTFKGFLTHCGHTYQKTTCEERQEILEGAREAMIALRARYITKFPKIIISVGDTPGISAAKNLEGIDEVRPGNYVFFDVMQARMNNCEAKNISITVACPIISLHPERKQIVVYGGGTHLSKEYLVSEQGQKICGWVVKYNKDGTWTHLPNALVTTLSQEHGIITFENASDLDQYKIGDVIGMLPVHSCMTSCVSKFMYSTDGTKHGTLLGETEDYPSF
ncbi:amine-terminal domain alanine racemase (macronuclear) [Tetrahymena thermophila SB210]|uniref:Amine-terminal domain alanine racemase n=1 Tax=Tetrahymena thermophila (strain SB210) TaxID=312017 RepID=I7MAY3_TETTS|nr:amine-terminal domain alanine racemase [Tetrahymena thermophila SB210]EAS06717.1 amine-terminal domain alanine racemase [Tetrahymena thermophila SB210]|eukprot:XP_001026959.1 amine-terminal domain alanine racemase [Tetrahymena thermophila SB210]